VALKSAAAHAAVPGGIRAAVGDGTGVGVARIHGTIEGLGGFDGTTLEAGADETDGTG
jgi:hypothetical protein